MPRKKEKYEPAKRTIEDFPAVRRYSSFGKATCRPYQVSTRYHREKLRKAIVYVIGPDSWDDAAMIGKEIHAKNKALKVRLVQLASGRKSKKWKPGKRFNIDPKLLIEVFESYL